MARVERRRGLRRTVKLVRTAARTRREEDTRTHLAIRLTRSGDGPIAAARAWTVSYDSQCERAKEDETEAGV